MPKARSKAEAKFWGAVAGGEKKLKGVSREEARKRLRGVNVKKLPTKKKQSR